MNNIDVSFSCDSFPKDSLHVNGTQTVLFAIEDGDSGEVLNVILSRADVAKLATLLSDWLKQT